MDWLKYKAQLPLTNTICLPIQICPYLMHFPYGLWYKINKRIWRWTIGVYTCNVSLHWFLWFFTFSNWLFIFRYNHTEPTELEYEMNWQNSAICRYRGTSMAVSTCTSWWCSSVWTRKSGLPVTWTESHKSGNVSGYIS